MAEQRGQASVELIAAIPVVLIVALVVLQLLAAGYTLTLADGAAEAGAIAAASGRSPERAARAAMPGWADSRVSVRRTFGRLTVSVRPPSPFGPIGRALEVSSSVSLGGLAK